MRRPCAAISASTWRATRCRRWSSSVRHCRARTRARSSNASCATHIGRKPGAAFEGVTMADDDVTLFGKLKSKLIDSKQKWAEDGRLLTGKTAAHSQRLPPGQRKVENWPVLDLGIQPEIPTHAWRLFVDGAVEQPTDWKWGEFTDLPKTTLTSDIHCV